MKIKENDQDGRRGEDLVINRIVVETIWRDEVKLQTFQLLESFNVFFGIKFLFYTFFQNHAPIFERQFIFLNFL